MSNCAEFDGPLIQRGIDHERRNGFVNVRGKGGATAFNQFMVGHLQ